MRLSLKNLINHKKDIPLSMLLILRDSLKIKNRVFENRIHLRKGIGWLIQAHNATKDKGVSQGYDILNGWLPSYPETSGYIIPTLLDYHHYINKDQKIIEHCKDIAEWECSIQLKNGAFPAKKDKNLTISYIFDTAQILLGLVKMYKEVNDKKYLESVLRAGNFLLKNQDPSGNWTKYTFQNVPNAYNARTAWILLELYLITNEEIFRIGAIKNIEWTLKQVIDNYWIKKINNFGDPITHFIAYTIRGILESGLILNDSNLLEMSFKISSKILEYYEKHHQIPASFNSNWKSKDNYTCLTGDAQLSIIWLKQYEIFKQENLLINAQKIIYFLKQLQILDNRYSNIDGAIKGSDPIWGNYARFMFPNWATKFFCDALLLEEKFNQIS